MPSRLYSMSSPRLAEMDRRTLKANLPPWVQLIPGLIAILVKLLPTLLPLLMADREALEGTVDHP